MRKKQGQSPNSVFSQDVRAAQELNRYWGGFLQRKLHYLDGVISQTGADSLSLTQTSIPSAHAAPGPGPGFAPGPASAPASASMLDSRASRKVSTVRRTPAWSGREQDREDRDTGAAPLVLLPHFDASTTSDTSDALNSDLDLDFDADFDQHEEYGDGEDGKYVEQAEQGDPSEHDEYEDDGDSAWGKSITLPGRDGELASHTPYLTPYAPSFPADLQDGQDGQDGSEGERADDWDPFAGDPFEV